MKYTILDLCPPSHSGECEFGFYLENRNKKWFWITESAFAKPGSTTVYHHEEFELPEDFFVGLSWKNFRERIIKAAPGCGIYSWTPLSDYPRGQDRDNIEALFK